MARRSKKQKPGWLARFKSVGWDAVTSQRGATGDKVRLVWLWPVSVSRTALASRQPIPEERGYEHASLCNYASIRVFTENMKKYFQCIENIGYMQFIKG
ncbi:MAG: hypothetical protein WA628_01905 [Terriglobales bacterium]